MAKMHKDKRLAFSFMENYYQVYKRLSDKQKVIFMDTLLEIQFLEKRINDVKFDNSMTDMAFHSILHHLQSTVDGYLVQARNNDMFIGVHIGGSIGGSIQEKEKEKEKEKEEYTFSFSLKKKMSYDNLTNEYKDKLYGACMLIDGKEDRYDDFITALRSNGYQYKNFPLAYMNWDKERAYKNFTTEPEPKLGKDWERVLLGNGGVLAVNSVTYETRKGIIT